MFPHARRLAGGVHFLRSAAAVTAAAFLPGCAEDAAVPLTPADTPAAMTIADYPSPVEVYGPLFTAVQMGGVFEDSKTFVDMTPRREPADIVADYERQRNRPAFSLADFVAANFSAPPMYATGFTSDPELNLDKHIERLWPILTRDEDEEVAHNSLIELPNAYVVPGGRFREVYYWDSYFTMLGLLVDGQEEYATRMVDNFAFLIDELGFVPNGNRTYYLSRSQPPFFAPMVGLLAERSGDAVLARYRPQLQREYDFWMRGAARLDSVGEGGARGVLRVARIGADELVNRYYDEQPRPRPEGFVEDSLLAKGASRAADDLYTDLRAACESGWDFSSRWLADPRDLGSIRTTAIAPVDLNSLLYYHEEMLGRAYELEGSPERAKEFFERAYARRRVISLRMFDPEANWFLDYDLEAQGRLDRPSLAGMFPLFFGIATEDQAARVAERLERDFLRAGGVVTSLETSGQQWDAPNGWPPLNYVAIAGLRRYGFDELAREVAKRWLGAGRRVYRQTGKVVEKYNVVDTTTLAGGGEYPNQDGFGWSNGVFARIIEDYPEL